MRSKSLLPLWIFEGIEDSIVRKNLSPSICLFVKFTTQKSPGFYARTVALYTIVPACNRLPVSVNVRPRSSKAIHIHPPSSTAVLDCSYLFVACVQVRKSPRIPCKNSRPPHACSSQQPPPRYRQLSFTPIHFRPHPSTFVLFLSWRVSLTKFHARTVALSTPDSCPEPSPSHNHTLHPPPGLRDVHHFAFSRPPHLSIPHSSHHPPHKISLLAHIVTLSHPCTNFPLPKVSLNSPFPSPTTN